MKIPETPKKLQIEDNPRSQRQFFDIVRAEIEKLRLERITDILKSNVGNLQTQIASASKTLNDATGYTAIEQLKLDIEHLAQDLKDAKSSVKEAKAEYAAAIQQRLTLQREINELLTRKHNWLPPDVERFTELYRNDHANEQRETSAQQGLEDAESAAENIQHRLTTAILRRYHEEQVWSDKIRRALTWGTWGLMGVNILLFGVATMVVEPWKRRRLVAAFNEQVQEKMDEFGRVLEDMGEKKMESVEVKEPSPRFRVSLEGLRWRALREWGSATLAGVKLAQMIDLRREDLPVLLALLVGAGCLLGTTLLLLLRH